MSRRLDDLRALRDRVDAEIAAEQQRLARIARLTYQLDVPVDDVEPGETVPHAVIREWAQANGYAVAEHGRIAYEIRQAYVDAHDDQVEPDRYDPVTPEQAAENRRRLLVAINAGTGAVDELTGEYTGKVKV